MRIGSLFSGIGGLELGLEWAGLGEAVWQVEQSEFCRGVLARHWPSVERYTDVRAVGSHNLAPVDLVCGGFPCQDVSSAGARRGLAGSRSGLWFEFARIVAELRPEWVVVENVASGAKLWVDTVCGGLGELGYATLPLTISAQDVGAPHERSRVFIVAHAPRLQPRPNEQCAGTIDPGHTRPRDVPRRPEACALLGKAASLERAAADAERVVLRNEQGRGSGTNGSEPAESPDAHGYAHSEGEPAVTEHGEMAGLRGVARDSRPWSAPPELRRVDDGLPSRMDRNRALGNAVVPQCAEVVGYVIRELAGR